VLSLQSGTAASEITKSALYCFPEYKLIYPKQSLLKLNMLQRIICTVKKEFNFSLILTWSCAVRLLGPLSFVRGGVHQRPEKKDAIHITKKATTRQGTKSSCRFEYAFYGNESVVNMKGMKQMKNMKKSTDKVAL